jgi:hypothetical protein
VRLTFLILPIPSGDGADRRFDPSIARSDLRDRFGAGRDRRPEVELPHGEALRSGSAAPRPSTASFFIFFG